MSGPLAPTPRTKRHTAALVAIVCGLFVALVLGGGLGELGGEASAQPPKAEDVSKGAPKLDRNNPVLADAPGQRVNEKLAIRDRDRKIFSSIEDWKPVASEAENPDEYRLWCEFVEHAKQLPVAELDRNAARDLTPIELSRGARPLFRGALLRFDGKLVCVRRLNAPLYFTDNPELGVKELYEVRLVPLDDSPLMPVSIVFTELPEALAAVRQKAPGEWLDVSTEAKETWVTASGYYFKTMNVPGEQNTVVGVPLLVGKSVTIIPGPPVPYGDNPTALDRNLRLWKYIKDDAPMIRFAPNEDTWGEVAAENRVILHASRLSAEDIEKSAVPGVKFADLFDPIRKEYKLQTVRFEGRLISLRRMGSNDVLRAAGINEVFEGWLVPATEPSGHPVVVVFTEPLAGVELTANGRVNKWVSFTGYSFKLMHYESAEKDDKGNHVWKKAPLLIGKGPIPQPDPDRPSEVTWSAFVWWVIAGSSFVLLGAGALTWYNWRGDRKSKVAMEAVRNRNPFDAANSPPA